MTQAKILDVARDRAGSDKMDVGHMTASGQRVIVDTAGLRQIQEAERQWTWSNRSGFRITRHNASTPPPRALLR